MEKIIRDGKVAILFSPGYGAGFVTWNTSDDLTPFEPKIVEMVEADRRDEITQEWCEEELGIEHVYCGGAHQLEIAWLPEGTKFDIIEYDGSETILRERDLPYTA